MLSRLARPTPSASVSWSAYDPRWYQSLAGIGSDAGTNVVPERAITIAVVFRAINVLAHAIASVPLVVYRTLENEGKEKAKDHPAYTLLHDKPNAYQTSFRWRHLLMVQKILYGNHYSEILPGRGGIGQLAPLSPVVTRVVDQLTDGRLVYVTRPRLRSGSFGPERRLLQDEVLHIRGFSMDGVAGLPIPQLARNAMGLALMAERHGSMFLKKGARFSGVLMAKGRMEKEQRDQNEKAWQQAWGGSDATGGTPIISGDLTYQSISQNNKDSQWLEARTFQVEDLLRFIGVPGVLCGYADKTATFASAEQFFLSFVTHTVRPETESIAAEINGAVIMDPDQYRADFILEGLLKGDIRTRYAAHQLAVTTGFKTRNEVRLEENYNKGPTQLDEFLVPGAVAQPGNQANGGDGGRGGGTNDNGGGSGGGSSDNVDTTDDTAAAPPRLGQILRRGAERLLRKEVSAIAGAGGRMGAAKRFASDPKGWKAWLAEFYGTHAAFVANELALEANVAGAYCAAQVERLANGVPDDFEELSIAALCVDAGAVVTPASVATLPTLLETAIATMAQAVTALMARPERPITVVVPPRGKGTWTVTRDKDGRAIGYEERESDDANDSDPARARRD